MRALRIRTGPARDRRIGRLIRWPLLAALGGVAFGHMPGIGAIVGDGVDLGAGTTGIVLMGGFVVLLATLRGQVRRS